MRKLILLIITVLFITGCDSTEIFEKQCYKTVKSKDTVFKENIKFVYNNKDEVLNIIVLKKYTGNELDLIKKSAEEYNNVLAKNDYVKIKIVADSDKKYQVEYNFDVTKMNDTELEEFNIKNNWIKLNNKIRESDIECK